MAATNDRVPPPTMPTHGRKRQFSGAQPIKIFVQTRTGKTLTFHVDSSDTELTVKKLIEESEGIPQIDQRLIFNGQILTSKSTTVELEHRIRVVDGPSCRLPSVRKDHFYINLDQPFFLFYHEVYRGTRRSEVTSDLSHAKLEDRQSVDVGGIEIKFHRTVRVPDNNKTHALPPDLGTFQLFPMGKLTDTLPPSILRKGGAIMGMYQREAIWISFKPIGPPDQERSFAVKVSVGGINALTGLPQDEPSKDKQDYLVVGGQPWLDRICTAPGTVRQFVAMSLGSGYTVEGQLTGKERCGGLQIDVFPRYDMECLKDIVSLTGWSDGQDVFKFKTPRQVGHVKGKLLTMQTREFKSSMTLSDHGVQDGSTIHVSLLLRGGGRLPQFPAYQGFAAGGSIVQKIYRDQYPTFTYDTKSRTTFKLTVIDAAHFTSMMGLPNPPSPISSQTYLSLNLPWYLLYDEHIPTADNMSGKKFPLKDVKSVAVMMHAHEPNRREAEDEAQKECGYCTYQLAEFRMQPCGHVFCESCCNATRCPSCRVRVTDRTRFAAPMVVLGQEEEDGVHGMSLDRRIVMLKQGVETRRVYSFVERSDSVSPLCGFPHKK